MAELDQEFSKAAGHDVVATFTPHLLPINRGILATIYVRLRKDRTARDLRSILAEAYDKRAVRPRAALWRHAADAPRAGLQHGDDRRGRGPARRAAAIIVSVLDNLVKGASGQAIQNANLMLRLCPRPPGWSRSRCFRERRSRFRPSLSPCGRGCRAIDKIARRVRGESSSARPH